MNILILPSWYQSKKHPTKGSFFREQAIALTKAGHSVFILDAIMLGTSSVSKEELFQIKRYDDEGITVYSFKSYSFGLGRYPKIYYKIVEMKLEYMMRKILQEHQIDIIHAHSVNPAGLGGIKLSRKYGIPLVFTEHRGGFALNQLSNSNYEMLKAVLEKSHYAIYVSEFLMKAIHNQIPVDTKRAVVPNAVNELFTYHERKEKPSFTFLSIGRLAKMKRMDLTIKAFSEVAKSNDVRLIIAGDGPEKEFLVELVKSLDLSDRVEFVGQSTREEVLKLFEECDAFVLSSEVESFGVVYIEALTVGRPVVTTKNGGAEEVINVTNGILVEVGDLDQMVKALHEMILNYSTYDLKKISSDSVGQYSYEAIAKRLEDIYMDVLEGEEN